MPFLTKIGAALKAGAANFAKNKAKEKAIETALDEEKRGDAVALIGCGSIGCLIFPLFLFIIPLSYLFGTIQIADGAEITGSGGSYIGNLLGVEAPIEQLQEGMAIPHYLQTDSRWGSLPYPYNFGGSSSIASSGCGPTSFAMIASYLTGRAYTPDKVLMDGQYHVSGGTSWSYFGAAAEEFGVGSVTSSANWQTVYESLKDGHPVIGSYNSASLFTSGGHFIVLRGVASDGTVLVNDPNDSSSKKFVNRHFTQGEMQMGASNWWIFDKKI